MEILKEIKEIIKEEKSKTMLLEEPSVPSHNAQTVVGGKRPVKGGTRPIPGDQQSIPSKSQVKDYRPGFNLYHGAMTNAFTQMQSMDGEGGEVVRKVTQWALEKVIAGDDTEGVFQGGKGESLTPQDVARIVQKAMLIALNYTSGLAEKEMDSKDFADGGFKVAASE